MISFFPKGKVIGFSIYQHTLNAVLITKTKNKISLDKTFSFDLTCKTALQSLKNLLSRYPSSATFPSQGGILRSFDCPIKKKTHRKSFLKNKMEALLLGDSLFFKWPNTLKKGRSALFALKQPLLEEVEKKIAVLQISPRHLQPACFSIHSLLLHYHPCKKEGVWIYLSPCGADVLLLSQKSLIEGHFIQKEAPLFEEKVLQAIFALYSKFDLKEVKIGILGSSEKKDALLNLLKTQTPFSTERPTFEGLSKSDPFLEEVGAALTLFDQNAEELHFSTRQCSWLQIFSQYRAPLSLTLLLLSTLFLSHLFLWNSLIKNQKSTNQTLYASLLKKNTLSDLSSPNSSLPLKFFGEETLQEVSRSVKRKASPFLLNPPTFLVSETLTWLKEIFEILRTEEEPVPFALTSFHYKLISAPSLKKRKTPYLVKVDLSFSAASPEVARKLHKELLGAKKEIDLQKKISWTFQNNLYQASFYLKNNST